MKTTTTTPDQSSPARTFRWINQIDPTGRGTVRISQRLSKNRVEQTIYQLCVFPAYQGEGLGVTFEKPCGERHDVFLNEAGHATCDCKGHTRHGHCKHASLVEFLSQRAELPLPMSQDSDDENESYDLAEAALCWDVADCY